MFIYITQKSYYSSKKNNTETTILYLPLFPLNLAYVFLFHWEKEDHRSHMNQYIYLKWYPYTLSCYNGDTAFTVARTRTSFGILHSLTTLTYARILLY